METIFANVESSASCTYGAIRKIHESTATANAMISASITPARSPCGLRARAPSSMPIISAGYTAM